MMAYQPGAVNAATSHNFVSYYDAHEPDISDVNVQRYGNSFVGFLDLVGAKKGTSSLEYSRFEKDRQYPKIKATCSAGSAGASVTFTLHADGKITVPSAAPYDTSATTDEVFTAPRVGDLIMIKPSSGTVSAGTYIKAIVTAVTGSTSFDATPINSADTIPDVTADEIVIYGNAWGEGSGFNVPMSNTSTKYTEKLQNIKHVHRVTGSENLTKKWFKDNSGRFMIEGEADSYIQFLNITDLNLLVGEELSNTTLASVYQTARTPLALARGFLSAVLDGGNILNYSNVSGLTLDDMYEYNIIIDGEKAEKKNLMFTGIHLDQQLDITLGDRLKSGAISYGSFSMDQEKAVNLSFQKFMLGNYSYDKRAMDAFNDRQTLGADGFGYKYEAFTMPASSTKAAGGEEMGKMIAPVRKRYLEGKGKSREMMIDYFDARTQSVEGYDYEEVRYQSHCGIEVQAVNRFGYIKRA
jgi:hypothetical protein